MPTTWGTIIIDFLTTTYDDRSWLNFLPGPGLGPTNGSGRWYDFGPPFSRHLSLKLAPVPRPRIHIPSGYRTPQAAYGQADSADQALLLSGR